MSPKLIVLFGLSGVGKTSILRMLESKHQIASFPKYTTRPSRKTADDEKDFVFDHIELWPLEDLTIFESYGHQFGVQIAKIVDRLDSGVSVATVLGDRATIEKLKEQVAGRMLVIFVFCEEQELMHRLEFSEAGARRTRADAVKAELGSIYSQLGCVDLIVNNTKNLNHAVEKIVRALSA